MSNTRSPALFGDLSIDHAIAGLGAGTVATLVMHPLDLVKVRFQLAETPWGRAVAGSGTVLSATPTPAASGSPLPHRPTSAAASSSMASSSTSSSSIASSSSSTSSSTSRFPSPPSARPNLLRPPSSLTNAKGKAPVRPRLGTGVYRALEEAVIADGWKGLYRGLMPNLLGGASSWGLYFLFYNMIKKQMQGDDPTYRTTSKQHLLAAAEASAVTAMLTNPIWVVKVRVFATGRTDPAYRGLVSAFRTIYRQEGIRGLYKGSLLALVGVSNGSIQFASYEAIKRNRTDVKRARYERKGKEWRMEDEKLTNTEYILASGTSKLVAIALTYPYQVVRARIQNFAPTPTVPKLTIPACITATFRNEGLLAFYKGLGTNALRILPGTCTTFVVYENLVWAFRSLAVKRQQRQSTGVL